MTEPQPVFDLDGLHPLRCDTCKYAMIKPHPAFEDNFIRFCKDERIPFDSNTVTSMRGCASHSRVAGEAVLDAKQLFLGKIAQRVRNEFCQDDDDEYYLCADDFENVLDELTQELMEEEEELRQQGEREP